MKPLKTEQIQLNQDIVAELVGDVMKNAVDSMEHMLKIRVKSEHVEFGEGALRHIQEFDNLGRFKVHVVKVKIRGDINGALYFVINGHEVDLINQVCLPKGWNEGNRVESKMMQHGFMSEIENVIAAQSIERLSEFLGVQILGGVPEIQILQGREVNEYFLDENVALDTAFHAVSVLNGVAVNITPHFIWLLDNEFVRILKLNS